MSPPYRTSPLTCSFTTGQKIDFKHESSALPKHQIKGSDATRSTRTLSNWLQRTSIALNTWSASAVQLWHNAVALAKAAHHQWNMMAPSQRALQTGLRSTGYALPAQLSVLEAIMRSDLCHHCLPDKSNLWLYRGGQHNGRPALPHFSPFYLLEHSVRHSPFYDLGGSRS